MSNYTTLKTTINANIRQNGNQEITGKILNSVLNAMVNTLGEGYQFAGIATTETDPGTPDAKVFFIANGKGEYAHFWALDVTEDDVVFLVWDNAWHKVATGIAADAQLKEAMTELAEIAGKVDTKQDIIPDLDAIREGAGKGSTALQKESDPVYLADRPSLLLAIDGKVSKEPGKGLSHNDFTDTEKAKLAGLENYDDTEVRELIDEKANEAADKFNAAIVQETGDSQDKAMSQKAVTDALTASDQKLSELKDTLAPYFEEIQASTNNVGYVSGYLAATTIGQTCTPTSGATLRTSIAIPVTAGMVCRMKSQGTEIAAIAWSATENGTYYAKSISNVSSGEQNHTWIVDADGFVKFSSRAAVYDGKVVIESERDLINDFENIDKIPSISDKINAVYPEIIQGGGSTTDIAGDYTPANGQSYGNIGSAIQFDDSHNNYKHYRIPVSSGATRTRIFVPAESNASSLIQYVNENDIIIAKDAVSGNYTTKAYNEYDLNFPSGADAVYISGYRLEGKELNIWRTVEIPTRAVIGNLQNLRTVSKNNLVDAINELTFGSNNPFRFRYMTWNVGHWAKGNQTYSSVTTETYEATKKGFRKVFNKIGADIVGCCEWSSIFYSTTGETAKDAVLCQYKNGYIAPTEASYVGTALFSSYPLMNMYELELSGNKGWIGNLVVGGKTIKVCTVHLPWNSNHDASLSQLLEHFKDDPYVVIGGDFNHLNGYEESEIALIESYGYQVANWGYLGKILTSYNNVIASNYLDNIIVKGGSILHTEVIQNTPEGANPDDPSSATEEQWDSVNLSDHFPIICDIAF